MSPKKATKTNGIRKASQKAAAPSPPPAAAERSTTPPFLHTLGTASTHVIYATPEVHATGLALAKLYLDHTASSVGAAQAGRRDVARQTFARKRKAGAFADEEEEREAERERRGKDVLSILRLAVEGFEAQQVWEQSDRIAAGALVEVERVERMIEKQSLASEVENGQVSVQNEEESVGKETDGDEGDDFDLKSIDVELENEIDAEDGGFEDEDQSSSEDEDEDEGGEDFKPDKFGLNDGFFSIEDFNRRTEALEALDARGEPDAPSDEEDVDWDVDPATLSLDTRDGEKRKDIQDDDDGDGEYSDENGPTFGDMDLDAPEGASEDGSSDDDDQGKEEDGDVNGVMYNEFFDPPARKSGDRKPKATKARDSNQKPTDYEEEMRRAIADARREYSEDESEMEDEDKLPANASNHQKRQAALVAQIRELEAENVEKRDWTLMGEARAQDRDVGAALDHNIDFERTGKPLPVVTQETHEAIEELIKRRVLAGEFDEVRRRRPEDVYSAMKPNRKDSRLEDNLGAPSKRGLAEVYEEEHLKRTDPAYVDQKTEKLSKQHAEIEAMWHDISTKLDSLASFNYKPKPAEMTVTVRSDAPAMSLEEARPSGAGGDVGTMSQLAPQEVFAPGDIRESGKVVTKGGTVLDRAELSRDQRKRMRQRAKERTKKKTRNQPAREGAGGGGGGAKADSRTTVVTDLRKGGVTVIGKKGELQDVDGNRISQVSSRKGGSSLRL